jgi:hypothetical protein
MDLDCAFCREVATQDAVQTPCGHLFCGSCWESNKAAQEIAKCPLCREEVKHVVEVGAFLQRHLRKVKKKVEEKKAVTPTTLIRTNDSWKIIPINVMDLQNLSTRCPKVIKMTNIYLSGKQVQKMKKQMPDQAIVHHVGMIFPAEIRSIHNVDKDGMKIVVDFQHCEDEIEEIRCNADYTDDVTIRFYSERPVEHVTIEMSNGIPSEKLSRRALSRRHLKPRKFTKTRERVVTTSIFQNELVDITRTISMKDILINRGRDIYDLCRMQFLGLNTADVMENRFFWEINAVQYCLPRKVVKEFRGRRRRYRSIRYGSGEEDGKLYIAKTGERILDYGEVRGELLDNVSVTYDPEVFVSQLRDYRPQILMHPNHKIAFLQVSQDLKEAYDTTHIIDELYLTEIISEEEESDDDEFDENELGLSRRSRLNIRRLLRRY